jgi:hypothetical protein
VAFLQLPRSRDSRPNLNWRPVWDRPPDLLDLLVGDPDATGGPINRSVKRSKPPIPVPDAMNHDVPAGSHSAPGSLNNVGMVRIGYV